MTSGRGCLRPRVARLLCRAADDEVDRNAGVRRAVERLDDRDVDDRVQLQDDPRGPAGDRVADLAVDEVEEARAETVRRDQQPAERPLARQPGQVVEQVRNIGAEPGRQVSGPRSTYSQASSGCSCGRCGGRSGGARSSRRTTARVFGASWGPPGQTRGARAFELRAQTMFASSSKRGPSRPGRPSCLPRSAAR
jgi:hypothetical protein